VDEMPWLGDDVGPGSDLRFKVTQDVAAGEDACVADREQQAVLLGEIVVVVRDLALLTGPDPGGGLDVQPPRRPPLPLAVRGDLDMIWKFRPVRQFVGGGAA
jgi:hypothetical protein